ncbi:Aste57867_11613 [Aphanomyces stellatus]|uniref:Aste57867_11613 protein n=1 Tax=Aphanomyces stellatus TaxID=120398 RepID=A0A485KTU2_9STRA|nr:hypothetical protein As57867_011570 [Aphanomyces stellatus]VFT88471.1 Aste57867_11613 [Aphanomyces stellatus]
MFKERGFAERAAAMYDRALQQYPRHSSVLTNAGFLAEQSGNPVEALNYYMRAVEADPTNAQSKLNFDNLYARISVPDVDSFLEPMPMEF